jgi:hypothetical protein
MIVGGRHIARLSHNWPVVPDERAGTHRGHIYFFAVTFLTHARRLSLHSHDHTTVIVQQDQVSTTDPDATFATEGEAPARLRYYDNCLV